MEDAEAMRIFQSLEKYVRISNSMDSVTLDDNFTIEELEAIIAVMKMKG
jgi:septum formation topological specificity factor MinE